MGAQISKAYKEISDANEEALRESQARLAGIVDSAMDAIITVDSEQHILVFNRAAEQMFHCPASEAIGQSIERFLPKRFGAGHFSYIQNFGKKGITKHVIDGLHAVRGLRANGEEFPLEASISQVEARGQKLYTVIMRDVSERERADERFRHVIEGAPNGIVMVNQDGNIALVNVQIEKTFGYSRDELLGQPIEMLIPPRFRAQHTVSRSVFIANPTARPMGMGRDLYGLRKDGSEFPVEIGLNPLQTDQGMAVLGTIVDITERKQAEETLRESEERLRIVTDNARVGLAMVNSERRYTFANAAYSEILGLPSSALVGRRLADVLAPLYEEQIRPNLDRAFGGERMACEVSRLTPETDRHYAVRYEPTKVDGSVSLVVVILTDIAERKRAETERRLIEARYRTLFEQAPDGIVVADSESYYIDANTSICRMLGYTRDELIGLHASDIVVQTELKHIDTALGAIKAKSDYYREWQFRRKDGSVFAAEVIATMMPDGNLLGMIRDITERKQAEEKTLQLNAELEHRVIERTSQLEAANAELRRSRAELNSLFESLPGLYLVLTPDLNIVSVSDAYLKATMTTREGILGRNLFEMFPDNPDDPGTTAVSKMQASIDRVIKNAASDTMAIQKHDIRRPDGVFEAHYWSPVNSPVFGVDREIKYIVHRVEDVTEFVSQKVRPAGDTEELRAQLEQMEAEIFQNSQKLQTAYHQLEAANKELEAFSYSVSHDLRAPLRHINGFSQALLEDYSDKLDEEGRGFLQEVRGASQEMALLIDDVLQLARVTRTEMRRESVNLSELAHAVIDDLRKGDSGRTVDVRIEEELLTHGDKRLFRIMLSNLLGNAWKFTSKQEQQKIVFGHEKRKDGEVVYFVRDNGAGFDMAFVDKLFGAFQRLHSADEFEGTGVGLATVQRILNRHGGRVWGEGAVNQGATFYFTLPEFKGEKT